MQLELVYLHFGVGLLWMRESLASEELKVLNGSLWSYRYKYLTYSGAAWQPLPECAFVPKGLRLWVQYLN
jgi:hypothetical protein